MSLLDLTQNLLLVATVLQKAEDELHVEGIDASAFVDEEREAVEIDGIVLSEALEVSTSSKLRGW